MFAIQVEKLSKAYGKFQAVKGISFAVEPGTSFGLLGPNGAGKTSTVKILTGLSWATSGKAFVAGLPAFSSKARERLGYLPENHLLPDYHTPSSYLEMILGIYHIPSSEYQKRMDPLLERLELAKWKKTKIRKFSKGMKQRLALAQAIVHTPDIIFLDEPTDGLDPVGRIQIRDIIKELKAQGKTIFINSHLLSEVEQTCDHVAILKEGVILREGSVDSLTQEQNVFEITCEGDQKEEILEKVKPFCLEAVVTNGGYRIELEHPDTLDKILDQLRAEGLKVRGIAQKKLSLEDTFIQVVTGK